MREVLRGSELEALGLPGRQPGRMEGQAAFLDCPAYVGTDGAARCGLPAEVEEQYSIGSTDGPIESARIRCPQGHWFNGPIEFLTMPQKPTQAAVSASPPSHVTIHDRGAQVTGPMPEAESRDTAGLGKFSARHRSLG